MIESQQKLALECKHIFVLDLWYSQVGIHHGKTCKGISLAKFPQDFWSFEKIIHQSIPPVFFEICINMHGFALWLYDQFPAATLENIDTKRIIIDADLNIAAAEANLSPLQSIENNRATINLVKCDLVDKNLVESSVNQDSRIIGDRSALIIEYSDHAYETTASALGAFSGFIKPGEWFIVEDPCIDIAELHELPEWPTGALTLVNEFAEANSNFERSLLSNMYTITYDPF